MAIADEVAAMETLQVQQQRLSQPVSSVRSPRILSFGVPPPAKIHVHGLPRDKFLAQLRFRPNKQLLKRVSPVGILIT